MPSLKDRLYRLCVPVPEAGCWLWTAAALPRGYGKITVSTGVSDYAHRVSWRVHFGEIPEGMFVCHKCDTPSCVNPDHLFLGTHKDNMADQIAKGRKPSGATCTSSKLTEAQVMAILRETGTCRNVAAKYGVSSSTIGLIRTRQRWKDFMKGEVAA